MSSCCTCTLALERCYDTSTQMCACEPFSMANTSSSRTESPLITRRAVFTVYSLRLTTVCLVTSNSHFPNCLSLCRPKPSNTCEVQAVFACYISHISRAEDSLTLVGGDTSTYLRIFTHVPFDCLLSCSAKCSTKPDSDCHHC